MSENKTVLAPQDMCWSCGGPLHPNDPHHEPTPPDGGPNAGDHWVCVSCGHYDWRQSFQDVGDPTAMPCCPMCGGADLGVVGCDPYEEGE